MTQVQFYHLLSTPLERALPKLLEKSFAGGFKTLVLVASDEYAERLNQLLWTYDPDSFLPHGTTKDGHSAHQPILLSARMEDDYLADILVVTDGQLTESVGKFTRILDIFDGKNEQATKQARERWAAYKKRGLSVSYLKQTEQGGWEQKAVA